MTIKDNRSSSPSLHDTDAPGKLAYALLRCRDIIQAQLNKTDMPDIERGKDELLDALAQRLRNDFNDAQVAFRELESIVKERTSSACTERCAAYFRDIFPYEDLLQPENINFDALPYIDEEGRPVIPSSEPVLRVIQGTKDLIACRYFLEKPCEDWPEYPIFQKEEIHASSVCDDEEFIRERDDFYRQHPHFLVADTAFVHGDNELRRTLCDEALCEYSTREEVAEELAALLASFDKAQSETFESLRETLNPEQKLQLDSILDASWCDQDTMPDQIKMLNAASLICERYALEAFNRHTVIPQKFRIRLDGNACQITIPNYLKFYWKRDFPHTVVDMIRSRKRIETAFYPSRSATSLQGSDPPHNQAEIVKYFEDQIAKWASGEYKKKTDVYKAVLSKYGRFITGAKDPDDKQRQLRRFMNEHLLAFPSRHQ